ncbi:sensor histidine kinase [Macrococcus lamae]|uniref:histidine kinase n=1 Tax=Macrococcus lamae TaxID=198484 RepID=A0A4R6BTE8_9STAP|nr:histidine kinase [Macrococcus lamae]TDM07914.1 hypothetical protein ERX29_07635 [Macrococcus lamae]
MNQRLGVHLANYVSALIFLIYPISQALHPTYLIDGIADWTAIGLYVLCAYFFLERKKKYQLAMWILLILSISYFVYFIDPGCILFYFFPVSILSYNLNQKIISKYGVLLIGSFILNFLIIKLNHLTVGYTLLPFIVLAGVMLLSNDFFAKQNRLQQELNDKDRELAVMAGQLERNRISEDLHDSLGQLFSTLSVKSELAEKLVDYDAAMAKVEIKEINDLVKSSLFSVRSIVDNIQQTTVAEELKQSQALLSDAGIEFDYHLASIDIKEERMNELVMLIRELTNNVIKHSKAAHVYCELAEQDHLISLVYRDDGVGLSHSSMALKSISRRVQQLYGVVKYNDMEPGLEVYIEMEK